MRLIIKTISVAIVGLFVANAWALDPVSLENSTHLMPSNLLLQPEAKNSLLVSKAKSGVVLVAMECRLPRKVSMLPQTNLLVH